MNKFHNPDGIAPPYKNIYSQAVETPAGARLLHISGMLGVAPNDDIPDSIEAQSELVMSNMAAVLASAGMTFADVTKLNAYFLKVEDIPVFAGIRAKHLAGARPAMTSVVVTALAAPGWMIEVDAVAAKAD